MIQHILRLISLFTLSVLFFSCTSSRNSVKLRNFSANEQEIKDFHLYVFEFDKEIAPIEKIGQWSDVEYVTFEPKIIGKFKWVQRDKLVFSPETPLLPATKYVAKLNSKITEGTNLTLRGKKEFSFHSPYFDVLNAEFFWNSLKNTDFMVAAQAKVYFSYPVDPLKIKEYLLIKQDGKIIENYQILTDKPSPIISIAIGDIQRKNEEQEFKIYIKKGLPAYLENKSISVKKERVFKGYLASKEDLEIENISAGIDDKTAWVEIRSNQAIDPNNLQNYISFTPKVNYTIFCEDNLTRLEGNFQPSTEYNVVIKAGLKGLYGGRLDKDKTEKISIANLKPSVEFANPTGNYLLRDGLKNIEIKVVNTPEIEVEVTEVYKNNVWAYLHGRYYRKYGKGYTYDEDNEQYELIYYDEAEYDTDHTPYVGDYGKVIYTERYSTQATKNKIHTIVVNLEKALQQRFEGIYVLSVRNSVERWNAKRKIILFSNIGLIVKQSKNQMVCFAHSMKDNTPVANTKISVIDEYNQTILQGTTNSEGVVVFENFSEVNEGRSPKMILAENGKDFNFMDLDQTYIDNARFDVGGRENIHHEYDTYLYAERNLYRPGETAHFSGIIRDKKMNVVKDIPVILCIFDSQNKKLATIRKILNEQGSFEASVSIPDYARTGNYTAELFTENQDLLDKYVFFVEEFVPDKIKINSVINQEVFKPQQELKLEVQALNMFGPPAAEKNYEIEIVYKPQKFTSKTYPDFNFYAKVEKENIPTHTYKTGTLDNEGKTVYEYRFPKLSRVPAVLQGKVITTVFDVTNRPNTQVNSFTFYPQEYYIGIQKNMYSYYSTGSLIPLQAVVVSPEDKIKTGMQVEARLIRYEWHNVYRQSTAGYYDYQSEKKETLVKREIITVGNGPFSFNVIPDRAGEYEIRLSALDETQNYVSTIFYVYDWQTTTANSFKINREGKIDIITDKKVYQPNENAKILFRTPFDGKILVSIEREKVFEHYYISTKNKTADISIPLSSEYLPNVYISATLFTTAQAINQSVFYVAHGYQNLTIENPKNKLNVQVVAPKKVQPNKTYEVSIQTNSTKPVFVTLSAVDEGICQIKKFQAPDPYQAFYSRKKLNVESFDLYKLMLNEVNKKPAIPLPNQSGYGGANEEFDEKARFSEARKNPFLVTRFKPVSVWSGIIHAKDGVAKIKVPIPNFNGQIRLMAVAYADKQMGAGQSQMIVADEVVTTPGIPRFMAPQDTIEIPVSVYNTTRSNINATVSISTEGPIKIISNSTQSTSLSPNQENAVKFNATAIQQVGPAKIIVTTQYNGKKTIDVTEISVRPASPLYVQTGSGQVKSQSVENIAIPNNYIPSTQRSRLTISKFPALKFAQHIKYLIGYPHGCLEQTTSKLFAMLYAEEIARATCSDELKNEPVSHYIKQGIQKIESMQLINGDFTYWQGGSERNWWGTVYATHFLLEAQKAGYSVDKKVLQNALSYIAQRSAKNSTYEYATYTSNTSAANQTSQRVIKKIAHKEIIYGLYVLALANQPDYSSMSYYKSHPELLSKDMKYLLAGAFALTRQRDAIQYLLSDKFDFEKTDKNLSENFDSSVRADAIVLSVLAEINPAHPAIPALIRRFDEDQNQMYWNTQERAFVCIGLGKLAKIQGGHSSTAIIKDGTNTYNFTGKDLSISLKTNNITITTQGSGSLYYFWSTEGIAYTPPSNEDAGLQVRRTFYDRTGKEIKDNKFIQNEVIICKITVSALERRSIPNLAISDLIPAGFEIENPRLKDLPNLKIEGYTEPDYMDIRDDRLLLYTNVSNTKTFYYMLRAVTVGSFVLPPIGAEAMYAPEYHSYHGRGRIKIIRNVKV
ncbi:MAG: MG2 domain-containing protein [Bacteroidia bacterium]|nr:MG2 domain-containing protein [Bacteroidia bacterium]MDW8345932.1 MG2 domain-containing protein [Bacteroidia bacterium]